MKNNIHIFYSKQNTYIYIDAHIGMYCFAQSAAALRSSGSTQITQCLQEINKGNS